jgi:hypothetical protein
MQRLLFVFLLLLGACVSAPKRVEPMQPIPPPIAANPVNAKCIDCGVVQDIRKVTATTQITPAKKPVLSGIVGGVVSQPSTTKPTAHYEILIQLLNGKKVLVSQSLLSAGLKIGSKVRVSQGRILAVGP